MLSLIRKPAACVAVLLLSSCVILIAHYFFNLGMSPQDSYRNQLPDFLLINRTNAALDMALRADYQLVAPELAPFGLHVTRPTQAACSEGDPSLYKYDCDASAIADRDSMPETLRTADNAVQLLRHFDVFMRSKGFDGEYSNNQKPGSYSDSALSTEITSPGIDVGYSKGSCSVEFFVYLSTGDYNIDSSGLRCSKTLLDGFYY